MLLKRGKENRFDQCKYMKETTTTALQLTMPTTSIKEINTKLDIRRKPNQKLKNANANEKLKS